MYVPSAETLRLLADERSALAELESSDADWESRQWLTPPGVVWSLPSDTCMTGRLAAPQNVAYGEYGQEFVFRQPRDEQELAAVLTAARAEVFGCYRFDGLARWTVASAGAWLEMTNVIKAWFDQTIEAGLAVEIAEGLRDYRSYLDSDEFSAYWTSLTRYLTSHR